MKEYLPETPELFDHDKVVEVLERLIDANRDAEEGYYDACIHIHDTQLRAYFEAQSRQRAHFAADLQAELHKLGKWEQTRQGSVGGTLQRIGYDVRRVLGGGDDAILQAIEAGEDRSRHAYQKALQERLPADVVATIRSQAQAIFAAHDHARTVRDRRKAA
jgi:uncharacterized protein (TIGR02284 family)